MLWILKASCCACLLSHACCKADSVLQRALPSPNPKFLTNAPCWLYGVKSEDFHRSVNNSVSSQQCLYPLSLSCATAVFQYSASSLPSFLDAAAFLNCLLFSKFVVCMLDVMSSLKTFICRLVQCNHVCYQTLLTFCHPECIRWDVVA